MKRIYGLLTGLLIATTAVAMDDDQKEKDEIEQSIRALFNTCEAARNTYDEQLTEALDKKNSVQALKFLRGNVRSFVENQVKVSVKKPVFNFLKMEAIAAIDGLEDPSRQSDLRSQLDAIVKSGKSSVEVQKDIGTFMKINKLHVDDDGAEILVTHSPYVHPSEHPKKSKHPSISFNQRYVIGGGVALVAVVMMYHYYKSYNQEQSHTRTSEQADEPVVGADQPSAHDVPTVVVIK